jgi:hypothetical protein
MATAVETPTPEISAPQLVTFPTTPSTVNEDAYNKTTDDMFLPRGLSETVRAKHYINTRWKPQVDYYDAKGSFNKRRHQSLQAFIGVGSVGVTLLLGLSVPGEFVAVISALIAVATAVENVYKYGDSWRRFRQASERLKREKIMFDMGAGPYRRARDPILLFTERCEDVILQESGNYFQREEQQQAQGQDKDKDKETPSAVPAAPPHHEESQALG